MAMRDLFKRWFGKRQTWQQGRIRRPGEEVEVFDEEQEGHLESYRSEAEGTVGTFQNRIRSESFTDSSSRGGPLGTGNTMPEGGDSTRRSYDYPLSPDASARELHEGSLEEGVPAMDALELLKSDHQRIERLFTKIEDSEDLQEKVDIFQKVKQAISLHTQIEEMAFYPSLASRPDFSDFIEDALDDHQEIRDLVAELDDISPEDEDAVEGLLEDLMDTVRNHIEEEESEIFPRVRQSMDQSQMDSLAEQLRKAKEEQPEAA